MIFIVITQDNIQEGPPLHQILPHEISITKKATIQPPPQADKGTTLWRSIRIKKSAIPPDYVVCLIDMDKKVDDLEMFL